MNRHEITNTDVNTSNHLLHYSEGFVKVPSLEKGKDFIDSMPKFDISKDWIDSLPDYDTIAMQLRDSNALDNLRASISLFNKNFASVTEEACSKNVWFEKEFEGLYKKVDSIIYKGVDAADNSAGFSETCKLSKVKEFVMGKTIPETIKTVGYFALVKHIALLNYGRKVCEHYLGNKLDLSIVDEINDFYDDLITPDYIKEYFPEVACTPKELAKGLADITCKAADAALYIAGKALTGALSVVEDAVDYVIGTIAGVTGNKDVAQRIYEADISHAISEKIDELYDGPEFIRNIGQFAEECGHIAAFLGASYLEIAQGGIIACIAAAAVGLSRAGETVKSDISEKDEYLNRMAIHGAVKAIVTAVAVKVVGGIHDIADAAYKEAVSEVRKELGKDSIELLISRLIVGGENAFAAGALGGLTMSIGDTATDLFGWLIDAKDEFAVRWKEIVKSVAIGGAFNTTLFMFKDGIPEINKYITEMSIRPLSVSEIQTLREKLGWSDKKIANNCMGIDKNGVIHYKTTNQHLEGTTSVNGVKYRRVQFEYNGVKIEGVFPEFDSLFDINLDNTDFKSNAYARICNDKLRQAIENDKDLKMRFSSEQLEDIKNGLTPRDFVWHHNEIPGKMQLVRRIDHDKTLYPNAVRNSPAHTGGSSIWGPDSIMKDKRKVELL